ncbi:MAG: hypothetical protein ABIU58_02875 [Ramlibacter sp.]
MNPPSSSRPDVSHPFHTAGRTGSTGQGSGSALDAMLQKRREGGNQPVETPVQTEIGPAPGK